MDMRARLILASTMLASTVAHAQPGADPYSQRTPPPAPPQPAPTPPPQPQPQPLPNQDAVLAEQIAISLVARATELFEAKFYADAKQLATEALVRSPRGTAAEQAKHLLTAINTAMGVREEKPVEPQVKVDRTVVDPLAQPAPVVERNEGMPTAWVRSIASGVVWGGAMGGLFADAVKVDGTKASHVALGAGIGAAIGGVAGYGIGKKRHPTRGDAALVDTLAGIGGAGGFTLGMLMQPVETEAYSVNAIIGIASGLLVGYIAAPQTNTTERRMLRVAGISLAGGALPFLLYAGIYDDTTDNDEQLVGALATAGLLGGAVVGFRLTRNMDVGKDLPADEADAPIALLGRHSSGKWSANGIGLAPLSPQLSPQPGMTLSLLGGRW